MLGRVDRAVATTNRSNNPSEGRLQVALALAKAGRFDDALTIARRIVELETRVRALGHIARQATKAGQEALAGRVSEEAAQVADAPAYAVAVLLAQLGRIDEALVIANAASEPVGRADTLGLMVSMLVEDGQAEAALRVARQLANPDDVAYALAVVAGGLARAGQDDRADRLFDEARQAVDNIRDDPRAGTSSRLRAQVFVARAMAEARRFPRAEALAGTIGDRFERSVVLAEIGTQYARAGQRAQALRLFRQAATTAPRPDDLSLVLAMIARAGEIEEAQRLAATLDRANAVPGRTAAGIFQAGVTFAVAQGRFEDARRCIDAIPAAYPAVRSAARVELVTALAQAGVRDRQMAFVSQALELAATELPEEGYRVHALIKIAHALAMAGL